MDGFLDLIDYEFCDRKNMRANVVMDYNHQVMDNERKHIVLIRLMPLLIVYVVIVLVGSSNLFSGDEGRYVMYAKNLAKGYYSPPDDVYLWNGPGYPLVLLPFILLKLPWITAKLLNPLFLFGAVIYFYFLLRFYMKERAALFYSYLLGSYFPFCRYIHMLLTEQVVLMLVCGFAYHFCRLCRGKRFLWGHIFLASFYLSFLALTKIYFGYVILSGLLIFFMLYIQQKKLAYKKTFLVYLVSFVLCSPYLFYTYSLTDKVLYWGNSGGLSLYLMSSPAEEEYGDWQSRNSEHHQKDYMDFKGLSNLERDDAFKKRAIQNIRIYPVKYMKNWFANIGRLWFNYPFSYQPQSLSNYFYILPNMFVFVVLIACIYPTIIGWRLIPYEVGSVMLFTMISFGGMTPLDAENRYLWPLIPLFIFWISFVLTRIVKIRIREKIVN